MSNKRLEKGDGPGISSKRRGPILPSRPAFEGRPNPSQSRLREAAEAMDTGIAAIEVLAINYLMEAEKVRKASVGFSEGNANSGRRYQNDEVSRAPARLQRSLEVALQRAVAEVRGDDPRKRPELPCIAERYGG